MACRIRHVAYVEKEKPLARLNFAMAISRPFSPSRIRSSEEKISSRILLGHPCDNPAMRDQRLCAGVKTTALSQVLLTRLLEDHPARELLQPDGLIEGVADAQ